MITHHTPGPWVVHKREDEDFGTLVKYIGENDDVLICATNQNWRYPLVNGANARLIAAAPDLLEALRGALEWMTSVEPHLQDGEPFKRNITEYRAAIAKAEGMS